MDILPHIGIDKIRFGMSMDVVRAIWGQPANIRYFIPVESNPEERDVIWEFEEGIELSFSSDDEFMLSTITSTSNRVKLNGKRTVNRPISDLMSDFPTLVLEDDFEENGKNYELSELDVSFWVKNDIVETVLFFPEYDQSGTKVIWPEN